ncbi:NAD(P)/FAD-dependent oxidoreductase [Jannaschia aquimarina]|uniref:CzcO protein n=1 Tax=Jannaschia aquimarina TaxID=935700 RepID=A0A0D1EDB7_9RHOB|nr:NAD(P)/FAD-dependent oxidoreductase [Jannaschia aquimarina]KIT14916.1 putative oxidoreductase CzcO [Jannaschia aquimarina]SNS59252.1 putative flavoprotein involved in K+ transport [Jannaschia aquimarina]
MDIASPQGRVSTWLAKFADALENGSPDQVAQLFAPTCYWRDLIALTWNIRTMEGRDAIADMVGATRDHARPRNWQIDGDVTEADGTAEAWLTFETEVARGKGHLRLGPDGAITLLTTAQELKGYEEKRGPTREPGVEHGSHPGRKTWSERRADEQARLGREEQPFVVIVGGGQGGIALSARLRRLEVPHVVIEKNDRAGDSWRRRYKSLCLHDPVWYDHLPYIPFPDHWPVFAPKDKLGDWLESYVKVMELPYWARTEARSARYDEKADHWVVEIDRDGEAMTLTPKHLVLATGMSGIPNIPDLPGMDRFKGDIHHSSQHPGPDTYAGKKVVVVGSNNSAHDISAALYEAGSDVTMVQRSSTHISRSETLMDLALGGLYSEEAVANGIDTDTADLIFASIPYAMLPSVQKAVADGQKERDKDFYERLEKAGFKLDFGDDETGLFMKYLRRGSGYYIDVGASELVADGKIKLAHGQVTEITETGLKLDDGTELEADVIVLATGYGSMNGWAAQLISQDVADKVGKVWGLGSDTTKDPGPWEGELRNMWKPTQQEGLWFHGGNLHQSRHYSQFLALQLKAREAGIDTPVYGLQEVHHLS